MSVSWQNAIHKILVFFFMVFVLLQSLSTIYHAIYPHILALIVLRCLERESVCGCVGVSAAAM